MSRLFVAMLIGADADRWSGQKDRRSVQQDHCRQPVAPASGTAVTLQVLKPLEPKSEQFMDSIGVLSEQNPKIKDVDLAKMLDATYFQNALDRKIGH